jgi:hypothetical protein
MRILQMKMCYMIEFLRRLWYYMRVKARQTVRLATPIESGNQRLPNLQYSILLTAVEKALSKGT